jgi:hypothetical protein
MKGSQARRVVLKIECDDRGSGAGAQPRSSSCACTQSMSHSSITPCEANEKGATRQQYSHVSNFGDGICLGYDDRWKGLYNWILRTQESGSAVGT